MGIIRKIEMLTKITRLIPSFLAISNIYGQINPIITPNNLNIVISATDLESTWEADSFFILKSSSGYGRYLGADEKQDSKDLEPKIYHESEVILNNDNPNWQPRNLKFNELNKVRGFNSQGNGFAQVYDREFFIEIFTSIVFFCGKATICCVRPVLCYLRCCWRIQTKLLRLLR